MRVGILTYHRTHNYGACLQAVATRLVLEKMGHEAYYVDYWPKYHANYYRLWSLSNLKGRSFYVKLAYLIDFFKDIGAKKERIRNFDNFLNKYILPYCRPLTEHFDVVLYGSDQIWRKQTLLKDYDTIYFATNKSIADKHVAFAASMGILPDSYTDREKVKQLVANFDSITVREDNLKLFLESMGYKDVKRIIDPTLLLSGEEWMRCLNIGGKNNKPYVLVYYVSKPAFDMNSIRSFAQSKGLDIKILCGRANKSAFSTVEPIEFLSLFRNASYTFVTSFHGLAFSVIFERDFYASFFKNSNRAETLLKIIGLEDRLLSPKVVIEEQPPIDYLKVNEMLHESRNQSLEILSNLLC